MSDYFLTESNFRLLNKIVQEKHGNVNYMDDLLKCIEYVYLNVQKDPPQGMKIEDYVFLMNKKVISLLDPVLNKKISQEKAKPQPPKSTELQPIEMSTSNLDNNSINHVFDSSKTIHTQYNNQTLERPRPNGMSKSADEINNNLTQLQNTRNQLNPAKKNIKFTIDTNNENLPRADLLYSDTLKQRELQQKSFANEQKRFQSFEQLNHNKNNGVELQVTKRENKQVSGPSLGQILDEQQNIVNQQFRSTPIKTQPIVNQQFRSTPIKTQLTTSQPLKSTPIKTQQPRSTPIINPIPETTKLAVNPLMPPKPDPIVELKSKKNDIYITIDSIDRDLSQYPSPFDFQINFIPTYQHNRIAPYKDNHGNIITDGKTIRNDIDSTLNRYMNISEIECISVTVPSETKQTNNMIDKSTCPSNIISFPYLLLNIDELKGPYSGTNKYLSEAFARLIPKSIVNSVFYRACSIR